MNRDGQLQRALQEAFTRAATTDREPDVRLSEVRGRARRVRARRRAGALAAVAAVVVVIGAPTALLVRGHETSPTPAHRGTPAPRPTPTPDPSRTPSSSPTPDATATPPGAGTLAAIPRGTDTFVSWADGSGVVHSQGTTSRLPGTMGPDVQFHELHGGWVVSGGTSNDVRVYDGSDKLVSAGTAGGLTVTGDRTRLAWMSEGRLYESALSTMGIVSPTPTPDAVTLPAGAYLIGYLPQGPALADDTESVLIASGGAPARIPVGLHPLTTSQSADLVGGLTGSPAQGDLAGGVYDLAHHTRLWHNSWRPVRFSDDGTLVAAVPAADNGDPSSIAILDARTGTVLAQTHGLGTGLFLGLSVAWDGHRLLFSGIGDHGRQAAVLALATDGRITRVSGVVTAKQPGGGYVVFEAQP